MRTGIEPRQARWIGVRIAVVAVLLAAGFVAISARAVKLQVLQRVQLTRHGDDQWRRYVELRPRRGAITDRNGLTLATSADAPSVAANPASLRELSPAELSRLALALALDPGTLEKKARRASKFVWLKRHVSPSEAKAVQGLEGVDVFMEARRYYTSKSLASQLVGFVDDDGVGLEGIELAFNEVLQGDVARMSSLRDAHGRTVLYQAPVPEAAGARVELAIDAGLQLAAEQALARAVSQARAAAGMLVAVDPRTGEVLALANAPTFNPNLPRTGGLLRNRAVLDTFEPGSTFKIFSIAGALDAGVLQPGDTIDCEKGSYQVGGHRIHDHKPLGWTSLSHIVITSSNIGAAKIGARLGRERLQKTLLAFGFGDKSGTELPGEPRGSVPLPQTDIALATMSFGQGVTATPLQITFAAAAIANGGMLMKPLLVRRVVDPAKNAVLSQSEPTPVRRAVTRQSAAMLMGWLEGVVSDPDGTGRRARLEGWRAAGKTGTAQKADPVTRRYSLDKRFSSFVGFAPADGPRVVIGVFIDEPKGDVYGGDVAAPAFREVADHALKSLGVPPSEPAQPPLVESPAAPPAGAGDSPGQPVIEEAVGLAEGTGGVAVPALAGLPARSALRALEAVELVGEVKGSGRVASQSPRPGQVVERGARVRLVLTPPRS